MTRKHETTSLRGKAGLAALTLALVAACASAPQRTQCPDGSHVLGSEANEQSGVYEEEVIEIEIEHK